MTEEKIQSYVLGELSAEESEEVAAAIRQDSRLQDRERRYRLIKDGFRKKRIRSIQAELLDFEDTLPLLPSTAPAAPPTPSTEPEAGDTGKKTPKSWSWIKRFWPWFVVAVLLGTMAWYLQQPSPEQKMSQSYFIDPPEPGTAGAEDANQIYLEAIDHFFIDQDYAKAQGSFTALLEEADFGSTARFYLPHTSFKLEEYERAGEQFGQALADENQPPNRRTLLRWNAMITQLALGNDISRELAEEWPPNYPVNALREAIQNLR